MRIGIDLLWVRPGIVGGTESFVRNLLDGFGQYDRENEYVLFTAKDNAHTFRKYETYPAMKMHMCPVECANQGKRILWENLYLDRTAKKAHVDLMFIPVYSKPFTYGSRIPYVCVIHDVQALHYPQYFSKGKRLFLRYMWWFACKSSQRILTDSKFCEQDLKKRYPFAAERIKTMYVPIISQETTCEFDIIGKKYGICEGEYYYCVSSLLPHKNLDTLLRVIAQQKEKGIPMPLVISGVGGDKEKFIARVKALGIEEYVIDTGFVSNEERDCLYEHCGLFLFPSVFEGFGMPPVEAMRKGKIVVTTRLSCLEEVTESKAIYVDDAYDVKEWLEKIELAKQKEGKKEAFEKYELENIIRQYMVCWKEMIKGKQH